MNELIATKYEQVLENTLIQIANLIDSKDLCTQADYERKLEALYVTQGNDMTGRGALFDAMIEAEIAAYEIAYTDFKKSDLTNT